MRYYVKFLLFAVLWGVFSGFGISLRSDSVSFAFIILKFGFVGLGYSISSIATFVEWYFPLIMFQILWGTYIYRHFCSASVYYFSRCSQRRAWFLKEACYLYLYVLAYLVTLLFVGTWAVGVSEPIHYDKEALPLLAYYLLIHSLWLYFTTLLINVLSIKFERSEGGFLVIGSLQVLCVAAFFTYQQLFERFAEISADTGEIVLDGSVAMQVIINPLSHLVLSWHSSSVQSIDKWINEFNIAFDLNLSVGLFVAASILAIWTGCRIVSNQDIIVTDKEMGV